jgi:hypothetical protein
VTLPNDRSNNPHDLALTFAPDWPAPASAAPGSIKQMIADRTERVTCRRPPGMGLVRVEIDGGTLN